MSIADAIFIIVLSLTPFSSFYWRTPMEKAVSFFFTPGHWHFSHHYAWRLAPLHRPIFHTGLPELQPSDLTQSLDMPSFSISRSRGQCYMGTLRVVPCRAIASVYLKVLAYNQWSENPHMCPALYRYVKIPTFSYGNRN